MKVCLECNEKIVGREDKKFCSDGCVGMGDRPVANDCDAVNAMRNTQRTG